MTDLHMHSSYSDGAYVPAELMKKCFENNLKTVSLTDHDTTAGLKEAHHEAQNLNIFFIPGIELSCETDREIHILGYHIDYTNSLLQTTLKIIREERRERTVKMIQKLHNLGIDLTFEDVMKEAKGEAIGRPHIAAVLVKKGYSLDLASAFKDFLTRGAPAYVRRVKLTPKDAIRIILESKGIPVLAHPGLTGLSNIRLLVKELKSYGLQGIEAYYPAHTDGQCTEYESIAMQNNLLITTGSDFHGEDFHSKLCCEKRKSAYLNKCIETLTQYRTQ